MPIGILWTILNGYDSNIFKFKRLSLFKQHRFDTDAQEWSFPKDHFNNGLWNPGYIHLYPNYLLLGFPLSLKSPPILGKSPFLLVESTQLLVTLYKRNLCWLNPEYWWLNSPVLVDWIPLVLDELPIVEYIPLVKHGVHCPVLWKLPEVAVLCWPKWWTSAQSLVTYSGNGCVLMARPLRSPGKNGYITHGNHHLTNRNWDITNYSTGIMGACEPEQLSFWIILAVAYWRIRIVHLQKDPNWLDDVITFGFTTCGWLG